MALDVSCAGVSMQRFVHLENIKHHKAFLGRPW
jgi:hypothetical protein